jgi:hypothetical protein
MLNLHRLKSQTALLVALAVPASSLLPFAAAQAQNTPQTYSYSVAQQPVLFNRMRIAAGAVLPVNYAKGDKILVSPTEKMALTLTIARNVRASNGTLLIPAGSAVEGQLQPAGNGSQFVAQTLVLTDGKRYAFDASSGVVTKRETISQGVSTKSVLTGATIGAGAATVISGVTGNKKITLGKVLIGGAAGALGGVLLGKNKAEVISINPNTDLDLTLNSGLVLNY